MKTGAENSELSEDWEHSGITRKQSMGHDVKMARDEMKCYAGTNKAGTGHLSCSQNTRRERAPRAATSAARRSPDLIREGVWQKGAKIFGAIAHLNKRRDKQSAKEFEAPAGSTGGAL